ncbi:hypothetical protein P3X46_018409 [Hevea brasiliensis]|uniref:Uncharacterized protein n=1 Tax=Hevea brasiliensis TaxID=3981 RepID=A0ABQ9LUS3_HEVBR|nr:uncharacterized protein LOC110662419 [Hevea brasiliensis]KAJ9170289.1 hypothetical protein P3X46_018409 [Hevea brasiliensis]
MNKWFLFLFIILSLQFLFVIGDAGQKIANNRQEKPPFAKMVLDTLTTLKKSHQTSWEKIKAIVHRIQLQFFPPNLDFRVADEVESQGGGKMKEAAGKSFEVSKTTAKESAKSAANVVGEAVQKVKDKLSDEEEKKSHTHEEL